MTAHKKIWTLIGGFLGVLLWLLLKKLGVFQRVWP